MPTHRMSSRRSGRPPSFSVSGCFFRLLAKKSCMTGKSVSEMNVNSTHQSFKQSINQSIAQSTFVGQRNDQLRQRTDRATASSVRVGSRRRPDGRTDGRRGSLPSSSWSCILFYSTHSFARSLVVATVALPSLSDVRYAARTTNIVNTPLSPPSSNVRYIISSRRQMEATKYGTDRQDLYT